MGTALTGLEIKDTYDGLVKTTDNGPISATAKYLSDGLGNDSVLALSTSKVGIGTTSLQAQLHIDGTTAESSFIMERDTVGANAVIGQIKFTNNNGTTTYGTLLGGRNAAGDGYSALGTGVGTNLYAVEGGNVGIGTSNPQGNLHVSSTGDTYFVLTGGATPLSYSFLVDANDLRLFTGVGSSEKLRVTSSYLRMASGTGGIQFNGDTAAANALDDYEEGTWTMGIAFDGASVGVTVDSTTGTYTKIGRQVTVNGLIQLTNKGSSTGVARVTGLPFTIANSTGNYSAASLRLSNINFTNQFQGFGVINQTTISLEETTTLGVVTDLTNADFANNSAVIVGLTYFV